MRNYEDKEGFFDYANKNEWVKYIKNDVIPLWKNTFVLKEFFEELKGDFEPKNFSDVDKEDHSLLLGGVIQREEKYKRNSLAKFYLYYFGLDMDRDSWMIQESLTDKEKVVELKIKVVETEFIKFVKNIYSLLDKRLSDQQLVTNLNYPEINYEELKRNPNKLKEIVENFYQSVLDFTINFNYKTFFLCSINQVPQHYIKTAYPRFNQILKLMQDEFGLIELSWNNPFIPDTEMFHKYTIFCFPEYNINNEDNSFGGSICRLNEEIWNSFDMSQLRDIFSFLFRDVPTLKQDYKNRIKLKLPDIFHSDVYYSKIRVTNIGNGNKTLMEVLDENSPFLFTNIKKIQMIKENNLYFLDV